VFDTIVAACALVAVGEFVAACASVVGLSDSVPEDVVCDEAEAGDTGDPMSVAVA
jgi:hypothetical protein